MLMLRHQAFVVLNFSIIVPSRRIFLMFRAETQTKLHKKHHVLQSCGESTAVKHTCLHACFQVPQMERHQVFGVTQKLLHYIQLQHLDVISSSKNLQKINKLYWSVFGLPTGDLHSAHCTRFPLICPRHWHRYGDMEHWALGNHSFFFFFYK